MSTEIERNQDTILQYLYQKDAELGVEAWVEGDDLGKATSLKPSQINDAVKLLHDAGLIDWLMALGTAPYHFYSVKISARGKYEIQRRDSLKRAIPATEPISLEKIENYLAAIQSKPRIPVGSPYGFTYFEWEKVASRKANKKVLYVVLGCKFESSHYKTGELVKNVKSMFELAVQRYNKEKPGEHISLEFIPLHAGYGGHLFNTIARDIMSSDIAVFETSDLAPNVFIEMGVALTYGCRVFPIKKNGCPSPPSDISGHTYANYLDDAKIFMDPNHEEELYRMVENAIRTKG